MVIPSPNYRHWRTTVTDGDVQACVAVADSKVTLYGNVHSWFEKFPEPVDPRGSQRTTETGCFA
jgi:hypothetical protein